MWSLRAWSRRARAHVRCSSVHVGVAIEHFSFQTLSSTPAGAATLEHVTGGVITQLLLLALTTTSPPTWGGGGQTGWGVRVGGRKSAEFSSSLHSVQDWNQQACWDFCLSGFLSARFLFRQAAKSSESRRVSGCLRFSGRFPVLRTHVRVFAGSSLVFTKLSDREVVPTAGKGSSGASMSGQRSKSVRGSDESVPQTEKLRFSTLLELFGDDEDAQPLTWTACSSWLPVGCRIPGRVWVHGQVRDRGRAPGLGTKLPRQRSARGVFSAAKQPTGAQKGLQSGSFCSKKACIFKSYHEDQNIQIQTLRSSWNL